MSDELGRNLNNSSNSAAQDLLNRGIRNRWYPVAPSWMVRASPVGLTRLNENIVLWRDDGGQVHAIEDRCPHRGARLSLGWNRGDRLACWYHGIELNYEGRVVEVPAVAESTLKGVCAVKSYPVHEAATAIFLWFGDVLNSAPAALELPDELIEGDRWQAILCSALWKANYRYVLDNILDPMHGAYLHAVSHSMSEGDKTAEFRTKRTDRGFVFAKEGQEGKNFDWVEFADTGATWMRLAVPYRKSAGPGGPFIIIAMSTPVDEQHSQNFFWRCRAVQDWQRDVWQFMYRIKLEGLHWAVLEQDGEILEFMPDGARKRESLYQHDTAVSRVRNLLHKEATHQAAAIADSGSQTA